MTKRINVTVSDSMNEWLDEKSELTGITKSSIIAMALEDKKKQDMAVDAMKDLPMFLAQLQEMQQMQGLKDGKILGEGRSE